MINPENESKTKFLSTSTKRQLELCGIIYILIYFSILYFNYVSLSEIYNHTLTNNPDTTLYKHDFWLWPLVIVAEYIICTIFIAYPKLFLLLGKGDENMNENIAYTLANMICFVKYILISILGIASYYIIYQSYGEFMYKDIILASSAACILFTFIQIFRSYPLKKADKRIIQ